MKCIKVIGVFILVLILMFITLKSQMGRAAEAEEHIWKIVDLSNNYNTNGNAALDDSGAIFYRYTGLKTKPLGLDAGNGNTITKIEFKRDGEVVRTVPVNSQTYNAEIQFSGEPVEFESTDNAGNGGWFAWQLGSADASWTAGLGGNYDVISSLGTPPKKPGTSPPADAYPNVFISQTVDEFIRSNAFKNSLYPNITSTAYLDNTVSVLNQLNPPNEMHQHVTILFNLDVRANSIDHGLPDSSTSLVSYLPYYIIEQG